MKTNDEYLSRYGYLVFTTLTRQILKSAMNFRPFFCSIFADSVSRYSVNQNARTKVKINKYSIIFTLSKRGNSYNKNLSKWTNVPLCQVISDTDYYYMPPIKFIYVNKCVSVCFQRFTFISS